MDGSSLAGKLIFILGAVLCAAGVIIWRGGRLPFGRLPGDLSGSSGGFSWAVPLGTCLVASVVLTVVINLFLRR